MHAVRHLKWVAGIHKKQKNRECAIWLGSDRSRHWTDLCTDFCHRMFLLQPRESRSQRAFVGNKVTSHYLGSWIVVCSPSALPVTSDTLQPSSIPPISLSAPFPLFCTWLECFCNCFQLLCLWEDKGIQYCSFGDSIFPICGCTQEWTIREKKMLERLLILDSSDASILSIEWLPQLSNIMGNLALSLLQHYTHAIITCIMRLHETYSMVPIGKHS